MNANENWVRVGAVGDIAEGETSSVAIGDVPIALYNVRGRIFATQAHCTHGSAELADGYIEGGEVVCPFHGGRFDIASGRATAAPCEAPLTVYETRIVDCDLFVNLSGTQVQA